MKTIIMLFSSILLLITACIEDFKLDPGYAKPRLVCEGLITSQPGPYIIRLTESHTGKFVIPDYRNIDNATGITDATIIISDNINQTDTLVPFKFNKEKYKYDRWFGYFEEVYGTDGTVIDTINRNYPDEFNIERGFYMTNTLKGIVGRTYSLKIIHDGMEYSASAFMPPVPDIDSIGYYRKTMEKDGQQYYVPLIYFSEPRETKNYYLIQLSDEIASRLFSEMNWQFSTLSDEFLEPYVNGLNISTGSNPRNFEYPLYAEGMEIYVGLSSLTKEGFDFYNSLLQQFRNDGGAYQLSPGSPPTNLSNGALGFFRASAISVKKKKIPYSFNWH